MASQPANTTITVGYTVRTRVDVPRNASIKQVTQRLGDRVVIAPGEEIDAFYALDSTGASAPGPNPAWRYGMPLVLETRTRATVAEVYAAVDYLAFPQSNVGTRQDLFIHKIPSELDADLHQEVRDASPTPRGLFRAV